LSLFAILQGKVVTF